jgi:hypothetical protein
VFRNDSKCRFLDKLSKLIDNKFAKREKRTHGRKKEGGLILRSVNIYLYHAIVFPTLIDSQLYDYDLLGTKFEVWCTFICKKVKLCFFIQKKNRAESKNTPENNNLASLRHTLRQQNHVLIYLRKISNLKLRFFSIFFSESQTEKISMSISELRKISDFV